jgi:acetylornithine deacetylase/succinyl-diaminopimelate desuccinylase-like protein
MADQHPADLCAELIRFDTTNRGNGDATGERDAAEYVAAHLTDAGLDPLLLERTPRRSNVITRIPGTDPTLPALLVQAHLDVVPADPTDWTTDPFAGDIRDGYVWGRGATDMKDMVAMTLAVTHQWANQHQRPRRDIVLAFVADEEDQGIDGAHWLVEHHPEHFTGVTAAISESGAFTHHANGVRLYPIGTAERGTAHLRLTATGRAGHGSRRNNDNAVTRLVNALSRLAAHRWPVHLTPTVRAYLHQAGDALGVPVDLSSDDAVDATLARLGPAATLAENTVRPSTTPTVLHAGYKVNVIPGTATAEIDTRVLPGTEDTVLAIIDQHLGHHITREFIGHQGPVEAPIESPWFTAMADALRAEDPDAVVVPYCMGGGTDAKAFSTLGIHCYGFAPLLIPEGFNYRAMAHGVDERVPVTGLEFGTRVLNRLLLS